jgi:putative tricarboxylic transport membrane protein
LYGFAIEPLGYPLSTFLFLLAASRLLGEKNLLAGIVIPLVASIGVFLIFTRILSIPLPIGIIGKLLE